MPFEHSSVPRSSIEIEPPENHEMPCIGFMLGDLIVRTNSTFYVTSEIALPANQWTFVPGNPVIGEDNSIEPHHMVFLSQAAADVEARARGQNYQCLGMVNFRNGTQIDSELILANELRFFGFRRLVCPEFAEFDTENQNEN